MIRLSLILAGLAICNAVLAVLMPWYVVTRLGIGLETDAFFASGALPQLIFVISSFALSQVLVPLLATEDDKTFHRDSWTVFLGVTTFFSLVAVVLFATTKLWVALLVPGFPPPATQLTITLTRIQLLAMIGNASVVVLWSVYYSRQRFVWAELSSLLANAIGLLFLFWTLPIYGVTSAAWAAVLTIILKVGLLMPVLGPWQRPHWDSYVITEGWRRVKPFLLGETYAKSDPLIDRFLTSLTSAGSLSLLYIGQQLYAAINLVMTRAIATPSVPTLAIAAKSGEWRAFRHSYRRRLLSMLAVTLLSYLVFFLVGEAALGLLIGHGGITAKNVHRLWWIMIALGGLLIGGAAGQVTSGAFYAMGDTRTPTMLFIATYTVYIPIKIIIFLRYGVVGLAAATSLHLLLNFLIQFVTLESVALRKPEGETVGR